MMHAYTGAISMTTRHHPDPARSSTVVLRFNGAVFDLVLYGVSPEDVTRELVARALHRRGLELGDRVYSVHATPRSGFAASAMRAQASPAQVPRDDWNVPEDYTPPARHRRNWS